MKEFLKKLYRYDIGLLAKKYKSKVVMVTLETVVDLNPVNLISIEENGAHTIQNVRCYLFGVMNKNTFF